MAGYTFDPVSSRYYGPDGAAIPHERIHAAVVQQADAGGARMAALTARLQGGELQLAEWQVGMMAEIKQTHMAAALAAKGGRAMMAAADYGYAGGLVKAQYQYLRRWAADLAAGKAPLGTGGGVPLGLRAEVRARLYATTSLGTFQAVQLRDATITGAAMEERNYSSSTDPCGECPGLSALGWVALGTLPAVGARQCRAACKCRIEYRVAPRAEAP